MARKRAKSERPYGDGHFKYDKERRKYRAIITLPTPEKPKGRVFSKRVDTLREGHDYLDDLILQYRGSAGNAAVLRRNPVTVARHAENWLKAKEDSQLARKTIEDAYRPHLEHYIIPFLGHLRIDRVGVQNIRDFKTHLRTSPSLRERQRVEREQRIEREAQERINKAAAAGRKTRAKARPASGIPPQPLRVSSQHSIYRTLHNMFADAVEVGLITVSPVRFKDGPKYSEQEHIPTQRDYVFSDDDWEKMASYAYGARAVCSNDNHAPGHMCGLAFLFRLSSGVRQGESTSMQIRDVEFMYDADGHVIGGKAVLRHHAGWAKYEHDCGKSKKDDGGNVVPPCGRRLGRDCTNRSAGGGYLIQGFKGDRTAIRPVILNPEVARMMKSHIDVLRRDGYDDDSFVFAGKRDIWNRSRDSRAMDRFLRDAGVESHYSPHNYRHSAASALANEGNLHLATALLGHSNPRTTQIYVRENGGATAPGQAEIARRIRESADKAGVVLDDQARKVIEQIVADMASDDPEVKRAGDLAGRGSDDPNAPVNFDWMTDREAQRRQGDLLKIGEVIKGAPKGTPEQTAMVKDWADSQFASMFPFLREEEVDEDV